MSTTTIPRRWQRSRARGARNPRHAVSVTRPGPYGNPYRVGDPGVPDAAAAVEKYRAWLPPELIARIRAEVAGRDVMCWCRLDAACHGDVVLRVAQGGNP